MPILRDTPTTPVITIPALDVATPPTVKAPLVDTKFTSTQSLLTHVEGALYKVLWYRQLLTSDSEIQAQQMGTDPIYQQYQRIEDFELRVTSPLAASQDQNTKEFKASGTAISYCTWLVPNQGDMFIANFGDGRTAVYAVIGCERKSLYMDACYEIQYEVVGMAEDIIDGTTTARRDDLEQKVVERFHYNREAMEFGHTPFLIESDHQALLELQKSHGILVDQYMSLFYSLEFNSWIVPEQDFPTYDPFLTRVLTTTLDSTDHPLMKRVREYNVGDDRRFTYPTIWDSLLQGSVQGLAVANQNMGITKISAFARPPYFDSVYYSGFGYVVCPSDQRMDVDVRYKNPIVNAVGTIQNGRVTVWDIRRFAREPVTMDIAANANPLATGIESLPDIHLIDPDSTYVFKPSFYRDDGMRSKLEELALRMLSNQTIPYSWLLHLVRTCRQWPMLEQFYYTPVLLVLIRLLQRRGV